ncbi:unnamed protein product [Toxocara canis]|uniref:Hydrolase_4 domain-containing protein n=1 Tax=Toxocara canis TaxID=6265 RepID=A0A183UVM5_TOXCA|nr:unnamed protein product [Toxocara canis]
MLKSSLTCDSTTSDEYPGRTLTKSVALQDITANTSRTKYSTKSNKSKSWRLDEIESGRYREASGMSATVSDEEKRAGCGELCLMILKCIGTSCYVFCPPVPELITRKLAFHPPRRGLTYVIAAYDHKNNLIELNSAAKAIKFPCTQIKPRKLLIGNAINLDGIETAYVKTSRGSIITIVFVRNHNDVPNQRTKDVVVLFSQPNGSDLGCYLQPEGLNLRWLANELDVDVCAYDYSGFGMSTGHASEKNLYHDIEAVYNHILTTRGSQMRVIATFQFHIENDFSHRFVAIYKRNCFEQSQIMTGYIVLLGFSIGTAPTIAQAARHPSNLCGVVLIAPFTSGWRLLFKRDPTAKTCFLDRFLSYERAPEIDVPVLICHGSLDATIPISHSVALHARMKRAVQPLFLRGADHLTIFSTRHRLIFWRIRYFLREEIDSLQ